MVINYITAKRSVIMKARRGIFIIVSIAFFVFFSVYIIISVISKNSESSVIGDSFYPNDNNKPHVEQNGSTTVETDADSLNEDDQKLNLSGQPDQVQISQVLSETTIEGGDVKKIDLMTDGSIRTIIMNSEEQIISYKSEYIGTINQVHNNKVYVDLSRGGNKLLIIPKDPTIIHAKDQIAWEPGVEVNWILDQSGQITSIQLKK